MKTFAIAGCGHLGKIVCKAYKQGLLENYRLVAAFSAQRADAQALVEGTDAKAASSMDEIISLKPDFIVETASIALLKEFAISALEKGISIIPLSIGAFADADFKREAMETAKSSGAKIYIPSGAVGGFDVLSTLALMAQAEGWQIKAGIHTHKGPVCRDSLEMTTASRWRQKALRLSPTFIPQQATLQPGLWLPF